MSKQRQIEEAIMEVIVFFDIFSFPLSSMEIWSFLPRPCELTEVMKGLEELKKENIGQKEAFYFLKGKETLVDVRKRRYNYCARKMKRALWVAKMFSILPWIKMIAIGNIMGPHNLKDGSDIDFFIVAEKNRIWVSRFVTTFLTKLFRLRPRVNDVRDKICLSFYISEDALDLEKLKLDKVNDRYFSYWLAGLTPLYDSANTYEKLIDANRWLKEALPNWEIAEIAEQRKIKNNKKYFFQDLIDLFFGGLDKYLKSLQLRILPGDLREIMNQDTRVVISDSILKFHLNDKREEYELIYSKKYEDIKEKYEKNN